MDLLTQISLNLLNYVIKKFGPTREDKINESFRKYITPLVSALSIYESNISNMPDNINDGNIKDNNILNICYELLTANEFWMKHSLDTSYICIDKLIYDLQTPYKNGKDCLVELFQQAWNNIFQYISLNQDILKNNFRKELANIIGKIIEFGIKLPKQYTDITSDDKAKLKQCYIFSHKQFVNSNIDKIINCEKEIIIDWCNKNKSYYPYKANVYQYLFGCYIKKYNNTITCEVLRNDCGKLFKDILRVFLSNNVNNDKERLQNMTLIFKNCKESKEKFVLEALKLIDDDIMYRLRQFKL